MMTSILIYYFLRNSDVLYQFLIKWFLICGTYYSREKNDYRILSHYRKFSANEHCLGLNGPYMMGISLFIEFVSSYKCNHLSRPFYYFYHIFTTYLKIYVSGYTYEWDLNPLVRLESLSGRISIHGITLVTRSWK